MKLSVNKIITVLLCSLMLSSVTAQEAGPESNISPDKEQIQETVPSATVIDSVQQASPEVPLQNTAEEAVNDTSSQNQTTVTDTQLSSSDETVKSSSDTNTQDISVSSKESEEVLSSSQDEEKEDKKIELAGVSEVPDAKRPKKPDAEKLEKLEPLTDEDREKNDKILKYGLESDIMELLDKLIAGEDVRYAEEVYDLFNETKTPAVKEKILSYFTRIEDPCLEDYAVTIINDPYDEKISTVNACFSYIQAVKTTAAVPAVVTLLESDKAEYFNGALEALGKIGGKAEAMYIADYIDRDDLTTQQKQSLVRVLGQLKAVETYDRLVEIAQDSDENSYMRMYACEAIGQMGKHEAMFILSDIFGDNDPNIRTYVIKGIANYLEDEAYKVIIQGIRDNHYKVRLEAVDAVKKLEIKDATPYLIYRAQNDKEDAVKNACYKTLAFLNTSEGNEYLVSQITDKKVSDATKLKISKVLLENMENDVGISEIVDLATATVSDDRRKDLRYKLGKEISKYKNGLFAPLCLKYIESKDVATQGTGLDMYAKGRYLSVKSAVEELASQAQSEESEETAFKNKKRNVNAEKAKKILETKES